MTSLVVEVPYRTLRIPSRAGLPETFQVRVPDAAVAAWLRERANLRQRGYPDRPPDVDTETLRAWLPRVGEQTLPYFQDQPTPLAPSHNGAVFPVFTATWHRPGAIATKVLISAMEGGSFLSRVVVVDASGASLVDKAHQLGPDMDPDAIWREIETIVMAIDAAPIGWGPEDPLVNDYVDFLALDAEVETAKAEAQAAGLLAPAWVH